MATYITYPFDCWMGLQSMGAEVAAAGYARQPAHFEDIGDGVTAANAATVQWGVCKATWGAVDTVNLYDAATAGNLIGSGEAMTIVQANMYDMLRVSAGGFQVYRQAQPMGFGTFTWGTGRYAAQQALVAPGAGIGSPYSMGGYGIGPYEALEQGVLLLKTFGAVALCGGEPGDWTPAGPYDVVVAS